MEGEGLELLALGDELDFFADTDDAATGLRLYIFLRDIFALIVKEAIRVTRPSNAAHVDLRDHDDLALDMLHLVYRRRAGRMLAGATDQGLGLPWTLRVGIILLLQGQGSPMLVVRAHNNVAIFINHLLVNLVFQANGQLMIRIRVHI